MDGMDGRPQPLSVRLRDATRPAHERLENTAFARALADHRLPYDSYVGFLKAMGVLHGVFERAMQLARDPQLEAVWSDDLARAPLVERDLEYLGRLDLSEPRVAVEAALQLGDLALTRSIDEPSSLVGYVYTLVGAARGQVSLAPTVARLYDLEDRGVAYMRAYGDETEARLEAVKRRIDALDLDDVVAAGTVEAAREAFAGFQQIFESLLPLPPRGGLTGISLNPEAGRHPVPKDPREIGAATLAGRISWEEFPYFEARYGERGRRFTRSDGAWLVTLCELQQDRIDAQVEWLTRVLAARGMPSYLMERHLLNLHQQLTETLPQREALYAKLRHAAERLAEQRREKLPDARFFSLAERLDSRSPAPIVRMGRLVVSAAIDDQLGRPRALESLLEWLTDPSRFGPDWADAVRETVDAVTAELRS